MSSIWTSTVALEALGEAPPVSVVANSLSVFEEHGITECSARASGDSSCRSGITACLDG
jgi:hypothetical protein